MNRTCDRCGLVPEAKFLRRLSVVYNDGTMITTRLCPTCYQWASGALREALWPEPKPARKPKPAA